MTPRTEDENLRIREERKERILEVAAEVFAHKGLVGARIADIAVVGGMSQGLIFRYFGSKEEVFGALVEEALQSSTQLAEAALQQPYSPLEKMRWMLQHILAGMWLKPNLALVVQHALNSEATPREIREMVLEHSRRTLLVYRQLIVEGQQVGEVVQGDPAMLAMAFGACVQGLSAGVLYVPSILGIDNPPDPEIVLRILKA